MPYQLKYIAKDAAVYWSLLTPGDAASTDRKWCQHHLSHMIVTHIIADKCVSYSLLACSCIG